jgi:serine/threonine protein kinase
MVQPDANECLAEATLLAWVAGELNAAGLRSAEAHMADCDDCRALMAAVLQGLDSAAEPSVGMASLSPLPGEVLAKKYRIEAVVGMGGMGVLFSARHLELGHLVAIKVLYARGAEAAARFLREGRIYARLSSPHIPQIYDLGRLPDGSPFLVMELLVGRDLASVAARRLASISEVAGYGLQACRALAEVHRAGIVHRDVKPANLFLVQGPDTAPLLKLLDFGISKFRDLQSPTEVLQFTSTSQLLGSPLYMSPEQIQDSSNVDYRTDIWSLGVVLYQLLTGRAPFQASSFASLCVAIAIEAPVPPRTLRPDLPASLEAVILHCLEKRREDRLTSLADLAEALEAFSSGPLHNPGRDSFVNNAVPIDVARRLNDSGTDSVLGPELMTVTVMFTDIADFFSHAETLAPEQLARALGRYLEAVTRAVESTGGTVDKYMGDALMVLWNARSRLPDHPAAACRAALEATRSTELLAKSEWWLAAGLLPWSTRFGVHTDRVLVGDFGASERLSYMAIGNGVNLAALLEGLNKVYGTKILVSEAVRAQAGNAFVFRQVDRVAVKDKKQAIAVYELCGEGGDPAVEEHRTSITRYESALAAMLERKFELALEGFCSLSGDSAASELAKRCQFWLGSPPPNDWDGRWTPRSA